MGRKPKTPLLAFLQRACNAALVCEDQQVSVEELEEKSFKQQLQRDARPNRREFLKTAIGAVALGNLLLTPLTKSKAAQPTTSIVIIGGGIAGLNAAYQLKKRNLHATIYEASAADSWGRIQTRCSGDLSTELGGEFIDTGHADMRRLINEFHLSPIDVNLDTARAGLTKDSYYFGGRHYTTTDVIREFRHIARRVKADAAALPESIRYNAVGLSPKVQQLDQTSIEQYLTEHLELRSGWLYDLLAMAYTSEFGLEIGTQSALNFLTMIDSDVSHEFKIYGESDERFKIDGGNGRLIDALAKTLDGQIEKDRKLEAIRQAADGKYTLRFASGQDVPADILILALPFSTLRKVDLHSVALNPKKREAIEHLGYGTNSKLLLDVSERLWRKQRRAGYLFSEKVQNGWDNSQGQGQGKGKNRGPGGYTVFLGGEAGKNLKKEQAEVYVNNLDSAFPGFRGIVTGRDVMNWSNNPLSNASYASYKVGQWTGIAGAEFEYEPWNNLFYCGEHCSTDFQGYMNGGAETGGRVAAIVARKLGVHARRVAG